MATTLHLQSDWETVKERLKENNVYLTDDDLDYAPGREDELLNKLGRKMKKSREEVAAYIESISANTDKAG